MNISAPWIQRPVMTTLAMLALLLFGLVAYRSLPVSDLPTVDYPTISVSAGLSGASPETMAASVATPLERQFSTIPGLDAITSTSRQGSTNITLQFALDRNIADAAADVQAAIAQVQRSLPRDMLPPSSRKVDPSSSPILFLALTSPTLPLRTLDDYAQDVLAQRLGTVPGVAQVQVYGSQKYAVRIQLDPQALAARRVGIDEVVNAVNSSNVNLPTGILWGTDRAYAVEADGQLHNAEAFSTLVIAARDGRSIRLGELGTVTNSVQDTKTAAWYNGDRSITLAIQRQPGTNTVAVAKAVHAELDQIREQLPASVSLGVVADRSVSIEESVHEVKFTLYLTLGLVVLVIFLFLRNLSATIIPSLSLPMSLVGTFAVMSLGGFSLNNLTLLALTLSVGFVVDDAIVMLENIVRHMEMGKDRRTAAFDGAAEIGFTILSMTVSLVAVFIPLLFMGGLIGRLFREFAVTIGVAILISGVVSLTLTPMLCSRFLSPQHHTTPQGGRRGLLARLFDMTERIYEGTLRGYDRSLVWVMQRRGLTLGFSLLILIGTLWLARIVPKGFIPSEDQGQLRATVEAAEGTSFDAMLTHQLEAIAILRADPNIGGFTASLGGGIGGTSNQGSFNLRLVPRAERQMTADEIARDLGRKLGAIPGLRAFVSNPPPINIGGRRAKSLYQYTLQGSDIDELYRAAQAMEARLLEVPQLIEVTTDLQIRNPQVRVDIDRERASAVGVSVNEIQQALYNAYGARQISTIYTSTNQYAVIMELLPQYQRDLSAMSLLSIRGRSGTLVPLTALAQVREDVGPLTVNHSGQQPSVTLSFNLAAGVSIGEAVAEVNRIGGEMLPTSITARFAGTAQAFQDAQSGLLMLLVLAILVIYIVLGVLYESFLHPLTILSGLPFAGFGALLMLYLFDMELSVYAFVGIIMLVGLVKKNAIMMIDFAVEAERQQGMAPAEAIYQACLVRFRPIMMTTMAALMGTLPIALAIGAGAESRKPLGVAVVGGLAFSQMITLYVTPVIYVWLDGLKAKVAARSGRPRPAVTLPESLPTT